MDDNVHLQDVTEIGGRTSWVTTLTPAIAVGFQKDARFKAALTYSADLARFHDEDGENHAVHRGSLALSGKRADINWDLTNSVQVILGNDQGPLFLPGGDIPAAGGIPLRERRNAIVYRGALRATWAGDRWMVRPLATGYVRDFQTQQRARSGAFAGYGNYVDRSEFATGIDVGLRSPGKNVWRIAGYRHGYQKQGTLLGVASPYSNHYHRFLLGAEGTFANGLRATLAAGPDFRRFQRIPGFHRSEILWFVDASLTATPTSTDTITLSARRFQQPGFASHVVYEDCTYELTWRRKLGSQVTITAGARLYITDFQAPSNREDWITTPTVAVTCTVTKNLAAEVVYLKDHARSRVAGTSGRDFTRQIVSCSLRFTF